MAVVRVARPAVLRPSLDGVAAWLAAHREIAWMLAIVGGAAVAHAWNMFDFPYYEADEGTYLAQAWSIFHLGQLAPYTYWYDHPPLGWIQLGLLTSLTGTFAAIGNAIATGRVLMLGYQIGSSVLLYRVARGSGRSVLGASVALLAFSFSAYGLYFQRRVLLDNIAAFWILAALAPLLVPRVTLTRVWISAAALGVGLLSKEIDIVVAPAMVLLVACRVDRSQRWVATVGWTALVGMIGSLWVLLAILKGELFPPGGFLSGAGDHVSLVGTLLAQAARDPDGGLLQAHSGFWQRAISWAQTDPLLVVVGTAAAFIALLRVRRDLVQASLALMAISLWLFLGRGGATLPFYLVPALPLLALQVGWLVDVIKPWMERPRRQRVLIDSIRRGAIVGVVLGVVAISVGIGYQSGSLGYANGPTQLWTSRQAVAQRQAISWIRDTVPVESGIVTDMYAWLDLQVPPSAPRFELAHYTWKVGEDPEIRDGVFGNDWHRIDYLVMTPQTFADAGSLPLVQAALDHADIVASFGNGDWPVMIERTRVPQSVPVASDTLLQREWTDWTSAFLDHGRVIGSGSGAVTSADLQSMGLLQAVYMDDRSSFNAIWEWTKANLLTSSGLLTAGQGGPVGLADPGAQADTAMALVFASHRWGDTAYQRDALLLTNAIWADQTRLVGTARLVVADARGVDHNGRLLVDLSGFAPDAYRVFAAFDPAHNWNSVVDGTYDFLGRMAVSPGFGTDAGVIPHWALVDPKTGQPSPWEFKGGPENLYDAAASEVGWRVGLDWLWNREPRAQVVLQVLSMPRQELARKSWLGRAYHLNGQPVDGSNRIATYTMALPTVLFGGDPELGASTFTKDVLAPVVGAEPSAGESAVDRSWAWFGTALMDGSLVDLSRGSGVVDWSTVPGLIPPQAVLDQPQRP